LKQQADDILFINKSEVTINNFEARFTCG